MESKPGWELWRHYGILITQLQEVLIGRDFKLLATLYCADILEIKIQQIKGLSLCAFTENTISHWKLL